jgi:hypothetical protein
MQKAGKYEIVRKIGAGGFGVVYEGRDPFIKRRVAIKTLTSEDDELRQRFFREAEIAGNLQHKNIVTIHDFGFEDGVPYLVQEFLPGEDLAHIIARREPLPLARKLDVLLQAAHGMAFAHAQGVIHRDVKPNNVRVLEDWQVKIMDFGIAKLANVESHLTKEGMTIGTAAYLPPEQIRGDKIDQRADIFSFGVLAYEFLCYARPFDGKTLSTLLFQIMSQEALALDEVWPEAPPRVAKLVASCLEKDVARRCPSFQLIERELTLALDELNVPSATDLFPLPRAAAPAPALDARSELLAVGEKVRRALAAGDLTAAELELTLAKKGWSGASGLGELMAPLEAELAAARARQDEERRRAEKLRLLVERGEERLGAGAYGEARHAFEAALELDPAHPAAVEGLARADAGLAWQAAEALRAAQATELVREGEELVARGDPVSAAAKAREALELRPELPEARALAAAADERRRALAAEEERRRAEERRRREEEERRRAAAEKRRLEEERRRAEEERRARAEAEARARAEAEAARRAAEAERRAAEAAAQRAAQEAKLRAEEEERRARAAERAAAEAQRRAAEDERARARAAERAATEWAKQEKRRQTEDAVRKKEEERRRAAAARADLARAKSLEATQGTQVPSSSFASAKLTDPQTLKWIGGAAAGLGALGLALWLALGQRGAAPPPTAAAAKPAAVERTEPLLPELEAGRVPETQPQPPAATPPVASPEVAPGPAAQPTVEALAGASAEPVTRGLEAGPAGAAGRESSAEAWLLVDAAPWGEVVAVVAADGELARLPTSAITPLLVNLRAGEYTIRVRDPRSGRSAEKTASLAPGERSVLIFQLDLVDVGAYFRAMGLEP